MKKELVSRVFRKIVRTRYQIAAGKDAPVFIHIPKTGGTFLGQFESYKTPVLWPILHLGHVAVSPDRLRHSADYPPFGYSVRKIVWKKRLEGRFVFSTCRNIFDWLVSYAGHAGGWTPRYANPSHYDYQNVSKGFEYLVKTIANRLEPWPCRKMIHFPIFAEDGELVVEWICRTETLDQDISALAKYCSCIYTPREKQRVGERQDYKGYYSDELISLVYDTWGAELALFGYDFNGENASEAILPRVINQSIRNRVRYEWATDILTIDGTVIPRSTRDLQRIVV